MIFLFRIRQKYCCAPINVGHINACCSATIAKFNDLLAFCCFNMLLYLTLFNVSLALDPVHTHSPRPPVHPTARNSLYKFTDKKRKEKCGNRCFIFHHRPPTPPHSDTWFGPSGLNPPYSHRSDTSWLLGGFGLIGGH